MRLGFHDKGNPGTGFLHPFGKSPANGRSVDELFLISSYRNYFTMEPWQKDNRKGALSGIVMKIDYSGGAEYFKPNNRPLVYWLVIILVSLVCLIANRHTLHSAILGIGYIFCLYSLLTLFLIFAKGRGISLTRKTVNIRYFHVDIPLDLSVFDIQEVKKNNRTTCFLFLSDKSTIRIFPATYQREEELTRRLRQLMVRRQASRLF